MNVCKLPAMTACATIAGSKTGMTYTGTGTPRATVGLVTIFTAVAVLMRERVCVCQNVHVFGWYIITKNFASDSHHSSSVQMFVWCDSQIYRFLSMFSCVWVCSSVLESLDVVVFV